MAGWMINCEEYAELSSQRMDRPLSFWDRMTMKLHQILCPPCGVVQQQFRAMRNACRFSNGDDASTDTHQLSDEACERMKAALRKVSQKKDSSG